MSDVKNTHANPGQVNNRRAGPKNVADQISSSNIDGELERKLERIKNAETLKDNIAKILEFDAECAQNGHRAASRSSALTALHHLCRFAERKPFKKFTKADVISFLDAMKNRKFTDRRYRVSTNPDKPDKQLANSSMNLIKFRVKRFFQWLWGCEKGKYPENVRWIEIKTIKGDHELIPEELPTSKEVKAMVESTDNPRDRALISLMAESGARVGEISTICLKDICWNEQGFILNIRSCKTKSKSGRRIPLCACAEDIKRWINDYHPFKNNAQAPLFISFTDTRSPPTNLKVDSIAAIVRNVAARAGVETRIHIHPHKFRHFRASQLAELAWNEPMLRQYFGWSKTSSMPAVYIHMSQKSMNDRYYRMYGKAAPEQDKQPNLEELKTCSQCGIRNPSGYRFCFQCNTLLEKEEQKLIKDEKDVVKRLNFISENPELRDKFIQLLHEAEVKKDLQDPASAPLQVQA